MCARMCVRAYGGRKCKSAHGCAMLASVPKVADARLHGSYSALSVMCFSDSPSAIARQREKEEEGGGDGGRTGEAERGREGERRREPGAWQSSELQVTSTEVAHSPFSAPRSTMVSLASLKGTCTHVRARAPKHISQQALAMAQ